MCVVNIYQTRAISTTRTIFRLNTNQSHTYEDFLVRHLFFYLFLMVSLYLFKTKRGPEKDIKENLIVFIWTYQQTKLIAHTSFGAWRVVSTYLRLNSPWCGDSRLLVIPYSRSRVSDYNPFFILFWRLPKIRIFGSLCPKICCTSIAHNIKVMMTCLLPYYRNRRSSLTRYYASFNKRSL